MDSAAPKFEAVYRSYEGLVRATLRRYGVRPADLDDVAQEAFVTIYRNFNERGDSRASALKPPKVVSHAALVRHFKECIHGKAQPTIGAGEAVTLMQMIDAVYKSAASGKSVEMKG